MTMSDTLQAALRKGREKIIACWVKSADNLYPFAAAGLLHSTADAFANPVGARSREAAGLLFDAILDPGYDSARLTAGLEEFLRVRAVQDMRPEQAVGPVFFFKRLIRDYLAEEEFLFDEESRMQVLRLETRIDNLVLRAFGLYMNCREALFSVKLNDMQRRNSQLLRFVQRFNVPQGPGEDQEEVTGS